MNNSLDFIESNDQGQLHDRQQFAYQIDELYKSANNDNLVIVLLRQGSGKTIGCKKIENTITLTPQQFLNKL